MKRERAAEFIEALHRAQDELYSGGAVDAVRSLLAPDVVWHVPGRSPIAGDHEGIERVIGYMICRREIAERTFRMHWRELLVGEGEHLAALTDGSAVIAGRSREWSTIGLYRLCRGRLAECWLIPFDQGEFDSIWGARDDQAVGAGEIGAGRTTARASGGADRRQRAQLARRPLRPWPALLVASLRRRNPGGPKRG
jgi:hypothetical protein